MYMHEILRMRLNLFFVFMNAICFDDGMSFILGGKQ